MRTERGRKYDIPRYETPGAAGLDLVACIEDSVELQPGERHMLLTGLMIELPPYLEAQVRPRSSLALRKGLTVLNSPGTIDADYRGEVGVILVNLGQEPVTIHPGERIAQLVVAPVVQVILDEAASLTATERGEGGFGSTGSTTGGQIA